MNQVIEAIKKRRSVRRFSARQVEAEKLQAIIECGLYAPSGGNNQPWHFLVIQNKELIDYISVKTKELMAKSPNERAAKSGNAENYHVFHHAPTVVIVSGHREARSPIEIPGGAGSYTPLADCSAAIENMLIAGESLGVGSCWIGFVNYFFAHEEEVKKLDIPAEYKPVFAVCLGYKGFDTEVPAPGRKPNTVGYMR